MNKRYFLNFCLLGLFSVLTLGCGNVELGCRCGCEACKDGCSCSPDKKCDDKNCHCDR